MYLVPLLVYFFKAGYYSLLNDKKNTLKIFGPGTWWTKKPFGYRVAHHGYILMSCPGH